MSLNEKKRLKKRYYVQFAPTLKKLSDAINDGDEFSAYFRLPNDDEDFVIVGGGIKEVSYLEYKKSRLNIFQR